MKTKEKIIRYIVLPLVFCTGAGVFAMITDNLLAFFILGLGILNGYLAGYGSLYKFIFSIGFSLVNAYVCYINGLNMWVVCTLLIYIPLDIMGFLNWAGHREEEHVVTRRMKRKNFLLTIVLIAVCSGILSLLLNLFPTQNLAFWDSLSNCLNMVSLVLINYRFYEGWYIWLGNNIVDFIIWIINCIQGTPASLPMLIVSVMFLILNVWGIYKWKRNLDLQN